MTPRRVVFLSADSLDADWPGGFALRDRRLVEAVMHERPVKVVFVSADPSVADSAPPGADTAVIRPELPLRDMLSPRQCVGGATEWTGGDQVVSLTPNVAHLALRAPRPVAVLEEGWERALYGPEGPVERLMFAAERARFRLLYRRVGSRAAAVVAISEGERRHFARYVPADRLHVVPHGVDLHYFSPETVTHEIASDVAIFGAANRAEQKIEDLVLHLQALRPETTVTVIGGSPRPSVLDLASTTVTVTGYVEDPRPYLSGAKVVAVPMFLAIGTKTTLLQAWALGCPAVTSSAVLGGVDTDSARTGDSPAQLAKATVSLLENPVERRRLGRAGLAYVQQRHDIRLTTEALAGIVLEAASLPFVGPMPRA